jgi:hypothetical protein
MLDFEKIDLKTITTYLLIALLGGSEIHQYIQTPSKILEVTHRPTEIKEDSIRTEEIATKVLDKLTSKKIANLMLVQGIEDMMDLEESEIENLKKIVRQTLDSNDVYNMRNRMALSNRRWLQSMFGYGREINGEKFFISPYKHSQKLFYSIPEGRNWLESGWWRLDETGTVQSLPDYKNIKLK